MQAGVEQCDDGNQVNTDACVGACKTAVCGDGFVQRGRRAVRRRQPEQRRRLLEHLHAQLDDLPQRRGRAVDRPQRPAKVCDHPGNAVCEQDQVTLCPLNWHLCSVKELNNRNTGWNYATAGKVVVGEIYCRSGNAGAGHLSLGPYDNYTNLGNDAILNCGYGSSRATCPANYGCNEQQVEALCCAPAALCGNGVINAPEEECDDGNQVETDNCLNNCSFRNPTQNGLNGTGCN